MANRGKIMMVSAMTAIVISCKMAFPLPEEKDLTRAHEIDPAADVAALREGQKTYTAKCGSCHYLHKPTEFDSSGWNRILPGMKDDAKLSDKEFNSIKLYLLTMCKTNDAVTVTNK